MPQRYAIEIPEGKPRGALGTVLELSRQLCLKQYIKPLYTGYSWQDALEGHKDALTLSKKQRAVFAGMPRYHIDIPYS